MKRCGIVQKEIYEYYNLETIGNIHESDGKIKISDENQIGTYEIEEIKECSARQSQKS